MKAKYLLSLTLAATALLVSCNKEAVRSGNGDPIPMWVVASVSGADTKSTLQTADLTDFYMQVITADPACNFFGKVAKDGTGAWAASSALYWADETSSVTYSAAFYPDHSFTAFEFKDGASLAIPTDQSTAAKRNKADLLVLPASVTKYADSVDGELTVALNHGLSIVRFNLSLDESFFDLGIGLTENPVTGLRIRGAASKFTYMPESGAVIPTAGSEADITPLTGTYTPGISTAKSASASYEAILVPQTFAPGALTLAFRINGEDYSWSNAEELVLEPGQSYDLPVGMNINKRIALMLSAEYPAGWKWGEWEDGDAIFVFLNHVEAPRYIKMVYDGASWISHEMSGTHEIPACLGLRNNDSGTAYAVFLAGGADATVASAGADGSFVFSPGYYPFYLTGWAYYAVSGGKLQTVFNNFEMPGGFVSFTMQDNNPAHGTYLLGMDGVVPVGIASVSAGGAVTAKLDAPAGADMLGRVTDDGYIFIGRINTNFEYGNNFYFARTRTRDGSRADLFRTNITLASYAPIPLPASKASDWQAVGKDITVALGSIGTVHTCNYGQTVPEAVGELYDEQAIRQLGLTVPDWKYYSLSFFNNSWTSVHGVPGMVIYYMMGRFVFLPAVSGAAGSYWSYNTLNSYSLFNFDTAARSASISYNYSSGSYALRY